MDTQKNNIVLTGGHAGTTGIAVIEELRKRYPGAVLSWIGTKIVSLGSDATSLEYKIYPKLKVDYYSINAGKLQTKFTRNTIPLILMIPVGFFQAFTLLMKIKPQVIVSFGGFTSFPVAVVGWLLGIPVILHEQTVAAGRASMAEAAFAKKIALARSESLKYFPENKCVVTGNPLTTEILNIKPKQKFGSVKNILVFGGSRGSEFINEEVFKIVPELVKNYKVVHITGEKDFEKYKGASINNYKVLGFVEPKDMPEYYQDSDLIISRAGANTVSEIIYTKRPAILIPLPRTFMNEQYQNAKYAEKFGIARVMEEKEVNPKSLVQEIDKIFSRWDEIVNGVISKPGPDDNSSKKVTDLIKDYV